MAFIIDGVQLTHREQGTHSYANKSLGVLAAILKILKSLPELVTL